MFYKPFLGTKSTLRFAPPTPPTRLSYYSPATGVPMSYMLSLQVISMETNHVGEVFPGSQREVREFLEERGYVLAATVGQDFNRIIL